MGKPIITIGADPEFFLQCVETKAWRPATGLIGGTKYKPKMIEHGALQEDNVMAEININPATHANTFVGNINKVTKTLRDVVSKHGLEIVPVSHADFNVAELGENPATATFGCDPDYSIYSLEENNPNAEELINTGRRVAGGHVHIGIIEDDGAFALSNDPMARATMVKACELYIGLPAVFIDKDHERKKFYGRAGAFRNKHYGVEYRVLSNFWLKSERHMRWVFRSARRAAEEVIKNRRGVNEVFDHLRDCGLEKVINTYNKEHAKDIMSLYDIPMPEKELLAEV